MDKKIPLRQNKFSLKGIYFFALRLNIFILKDIMNRCFLSSFLRFAKIRVFITFSYPIITLSHPVPSAIV